MPQMGRNSRISADTHAGATRPVAAGRSTASSAAHAPRPSNGAQNARRRAARFRRRVATLVFGMLASLALLGALVYVKANYVDAPKRVQLYEQLQSGTYLEGVTIGGVNVSGIDRKSVV